MNQEKNRIINSDVRELRLTDMFIQVFRRWMILLLCLIIGAVLFTGYSCVKGISGPKAAAARAQAQADADAAEINEELQNRITGLETLISQYEASAAKQGEYIQNSVYMQIDPYHVQKATGLLLVYSDEDADETEVASLLSVYQDAAVSDSVLSPIAEDLGIDTVYLREVVGASVDVSSGKVSVSVSYTDADTAANVLNAIMDALQARTASYSEQMIAHRVVVTGVATKEVVDNYMFDNQNAVWDDVHEYNKNIEDAKSDLSSLRSDLSSSTPSAYVAGQRSISEDIVIGAVMGLVIGFIVMCLIYLLSDKIKSDNELRKSTDLAIFSDHSAPSGRKPVQALLDRLQGLTAYDEGAARRMAELVLPKIGGAGSIAIVSSLNESKIKAMTEEFTRELKALRPGFEVVICADVNDSYTVIDSIKSAEAVVIFERCHNSKLKKVLYELDLMSNVRDDIAGIIVKDI